MQTMSAKRREAGQKEQRKFSSDFRKKKKKSFMMIQHWHRFLSRMVVYSPFSEECTNTLNQLLSGIVTAAQFFLEIG